MKSYESTAKFEEKKGGGGGGRGGLGGGCKELLEE